jgi:uncharacterized protein YbaR (Trm112 family)
MHLLLTDVLTCPRCGPGFGLIVLADSVDDRLVLEGRLGCANCREEYPIRGGMVDLRAGGAGGIARTDGEPAAGEERAFRTAALLGVGHGLGTVLVIGGSADFVARIQDLLPNSQVVGAGETAAESTGAGWLVLGATLPFRDSALRGVAVLGGAGAGTVREAARALAPGARLVLDPAPPAAADVLAECGLTVLLDQDGVVVASTSAPG